MQNIGATISTASPESGPPIVPTRVLSIGLDFTLVADRSIVLHSAGYSVQSALSTKDAVHRFGKNNFDLVILCHSIPTRERIRLTSLMRAQGTPIAVISATERPLPCDAFTSATVESDPGKFLPERGH